MRRAPPFAANLPARFEFRQLTDTKMRGADAIAPADPARYFPRIDPVAP